MSEKNVSSHLGCHQIYLVKCHYPTRLFLGHPTLLKPLEVQGCIVSHLKIHHLILLSGKTKLVCEKCGFSTISKHKLRSHIREKHEIEKHKKCPYCEYSSHQSTKILIHIDIKHPETGEKQFQCDKCNTTFIYEQVRETFSSKFHHQMALTWTP